MYHDIVPKKDARDLSLIKNKLDADKYDTAEGLEADIDLMVQNAITFNGLESVVGAAAITFQNKFRQLTSGTKSFSKKRKPETSKETPLGNGSAKKARHS